MTRTDVYRFQSTQIKSDGCPLSVMGIGSIIYRKQERKVLFNKIPGAMFSNEIWL